MRGLKLRSILSNKLSGWTHIKRRKNVIQSGKHFSIILFLSGEISTNGQEGTACTGMEAGSIFISLATLRSRDDNKKAFSWSKL